MARNKSEKLRKQRLEDYYAAMLGHWPDKRGIGDDSPELARRDKRFEDAVNRAYYRMDAADRFALSLIHNTARRFEWMEKRLRDAT